MKALEGRHRLDAALRIAAALLGALPVAMLAAICVARFLPFAESLRFILGFSLSFPLWVATVCYVFLARRAWNAWRFCVVASLFLSLLAFGLPSW